MKTKLLAALFAVAFAATTPATAADASAPSHASAEASGYVVAGSLVASLVGGSLVVISVDKVGDGIELVLKNAVDASKATVRITGKAARELSIAAGTVLQVVASSTGHMLVMSGKAIAFIPNEAGKALLRSKPAN